MNSFIHFTNSVKKVCNIGEIARKDICHITLVLYGSYLPNIIEIMQFYTSSGA